MPTPLSHAAVGFAIAAWTQPQPLNRRVCIAAAACAALPDVDFAGLPFQISSASLFGHRALTHSIFFALVAALATTVVFFRKAQPPQARARIAIVLGLAFLSHSCLDALTTYSYGIAFFAPFSLQRFRFLWTPLGDPNWTLAQQLVQDAGVVFLPAVVVGWIGLRIRGTTVARSATRKIVLVRHGKPDWDFRTRVPGHALAQWLQGQDTAALDPALRPDATLQKIIAGVTCVIASPLRRSVDSAQVLVPASVPVVDDHFGEAPLPSAIPFRLRLRPDTWAVLLRAAWFCGWSGGVESFRAARKRAAAAADILTAHAAAHNVVVLVGHGLMNALIAARLRALGWKGPRLPAYRHWTFGVYEPRKRFDP